MVAVRKWGITIGRSKAEVVEEEEEEEEVEAFFRLGVVVD